MTMYRVLPVVAALLLAGCGGQNDAANNRAVAEPAATNMAADPVANDSAGNATQAVLALSDRQRNAVFIRAILDAGLKCEGVTRSERIGDQNGQPTWRAECGKSEGHLISIAPDGTATINSRSD